MMDILTEGEEKSFMDMQMLNKDFLIIATEELGCIYYVPQKRLAKIDSKVALELKKCQLGERELTAVQRELLNSLRDGKFASEKTEKETANRITEIELVVSTKCNLNCVYCYANGGNYQGKESIMPFETADAVVRYLKENKIEIGTVQFFGGEPMLAYQTISYLCGQLQKNDISVGKYAMVSNLTFLPEEFLEDIAKYNIHITASIDGPKEITNKQRLSRDKRLDVYDTIVQNINRLRNRGLDITAVECTYTDAHRNAGYTSEKLKKFFKQELGVENVILENASDVFCGDDKADDYADYFQSPEMSLEEIKFLKFLLDKKTENSVFCLAGIRKYAIFPDGSIYPCHLFAPMKEEYRMGNVFDIVWDKSEKCNVTLRKLEKVKQMCHCADCKGRNFCHQCIASVLLSPKAVDCEKNIEIYAGVINNYMKSKCITSNIKK
ncbi:MAG: radical SAM protein [Roseburia sp.]|nr:radical SAM protein [Roseburia sp.]